jgi:adenine/guanine/hypoxanthine permease
MNRYGWARWGDVNAFFGLMLDNVAVMVILVSAITLGPVGAEETKFTPQFVLTRMIPGTALGVLIGDLVYTWMAFRLARRTGRSDVTAMPLGLDTPSTFGVAFLVLLPSLQEGTRDLKLGHDEAMLFAWRVGVVVLLICGVFKVICAPFGNLVRRWVPSAGLLGSLAAIALALIAFLPLVLDGIAAVPVVGLLALTVILITLVAHRSLPGQFPGALAAVLLGLLIYLGGEWFGRLTGWPLVPAIERTPAPAWQPPALLSALSAEYALWDRVLWSALGKLPIALPFALATIVGGIDCTESAAAAGDEYDTRSILMTEGVASVLAACFGGVIQTTPYIGHPAYKTMGGRAAYTLATALFVGAAGYFGLFTQLFDWLPRPAMFPILVFVGLEITAQSFRATPPRHYAALALAMLPALAALVLVPLDKVLAGRQPLDPEGGVVLLTLRCLANGFIVTSLLWAAALAALLDGRLRASAGYLAVAGVFAFFGVIHSPLPAAPIDLPWHVFAQLQTEHGGDARFLSQSPYHWALAYGLSAVLLGVLSFFPGKHATAPETPSEADLPHGGAVL